jgi:hypothetical protein
VIFPRFSKASQRLQINLLLIKAISLSFGLTNAQESLRIGWLVPRIKFSSIICLKIWSEQTSRETGVV